MTVVGDFFVVLLIIMDHHLHSPMYFLLVSLLFVDFCLSSVTTPKLITDLCEDDKTISFGACMSQILCCISFVEVKWCFLYVLRLLCGHLKTTQLLQCHGQMRVYLASFDITDHWLCACRESTAYDPGAALLWTQSS